MQFQSSTRLANSNNQGGHWPQVIESP